MESIDQLIQSLKKIPHLDCCTIGTLGPSGTSSEETACFLVENLKKECEFSPDIHLYDTFDEVQNALVADQITFALVPNAYDRVNEYYIHPEMRWIDHFTHHTPAYGLAKRNDTEIPMKQCRIVTHPAPRLLIKHLLSQLPHPPQHYSVSLVHSTSLAAKLVKDREADLAITNALAAEREGLIFIQDFGKIKMSWSLFCKKSLLDQLKK